MSDSSRPHGLQPTRLLHPWDFQGKSTGVGCHCLVLIEHLKEISPGCSFEGVMLKLKFQYFGYLMQRTDSLDKTLMLERLKAGVEGDKRG